MPATARKPRTLLLVLLLLFGLAFPTLAADDPPVFPLADVKPGMQGVVYTIFDGDKIEPINLEVIGVLHNAVGPQRDVILVRLLGEKVAKTGVVAGMSGSPVYFDGKLGGALALKLGTFTKDAIGGVTPIADMLKVAHYPLSPALPKTVPVPSGPAAHRIASGPVDNPEPSMEGWTVTPSAPVYASEQLSLPDGLARSAAAGAGQVLVPIETPLVTTGLYPQTLATFGSAFFRHGMALMEGGTAAPTPGDAKLKPGDMVGIDLIRGDLSMTAGCTVTAVEGDRILACGHPLFGFGRVSMPLSAAHVMMTLASSATSTKIITTGPTIGTLTQDRQTAVSGTLGPGPSMIPLDMSLETPDGERKYHFEVVESPQLTSVLIATAAFNGIAGSAIYGEGTTLQLDGEIDLQGHTPVHLEDLFAPTDQTTPAGFYLATKVQSAFAQIYSNSYERPKVTQVRLRVKALPKHRWAMIDNAWADKSEVRPGETVKVRVLLRPYRGAPFIQEIPITVPPQIPRGMLEVVVSDAAFLNRNVQVLAMTSQGQLPGLEEQIKLMNRERRNSHLYATLLQAAPTILVEDKEMPNAPLSTINVLDQRQNPGGARLLWQSTAGEWSVDMHEVIAGQRLLMLTVK